MRWEKPYRRHDTKRHLSAGDAGISPELRFGHLASRIDSHPALPYHVDGKKSMKFNTRYHSVWWPVITISGVSALAWFVNSYTPDSWQYIAMFFTLVALIITSFLHYLLNNVRHILLITGGVLILLLLRLLGLREIIYPLLLAATLLSLELMLRKR